MRNAAILCGLLALAGCSAQTQTMDKPVAIGPEKIRPAEGEQGA